jgi:hypothetical protein
MLFIFSVVRDLEICKEAQSPFIGVCIQKSGTYDYG